MLKKDYGFDKVFNIFDEIDNNCFELHKFNPRNLNMINRKYEIIESLKIVEWKLIDMFSTPSVVRKINNANHKGYVNKKLNEEMNSENTRLNEAILDSFNLKSLER